MRLRLAFLALAAALSACTTINADFETIDGKNYAVASVTKPDDEFIVVTVLRRDRPDPAIARRDKATHLRAAQPEFVRACRRKGGRPTRKDVIEGFDSRFENDGETAGWTFVRNCV